MNKKMLSILLLFTLTMAACGSAQSDPTQASTDLPAAAKLIIGTLKLEDTEQAVTSEQAKELLVMWQVYQSLIASDTAAQAEIDGLVDQIQETMTSEQMKVISDMKLTQQDVVILEQEQGIGMGLPQQSSNGSGSTQNSGGFAPPDGGMAGGAPPDGGNAGDTQGIGGAGSSPGTGQSQGAGAGSSVGNTAGISNRLVEALIQILEQKTVS